MTATEVKTLVQKHKILIIGSSGFIGSHLSSLLAEQGHEVCGFDVHEPDEDFGITHFYTGDVRSKSDLLEALEGIDTVINLAAIHFDFGHADSEYFETNEHGMEVLLSAMTELGIRRLLFTSSIAVYGEYAGWADEDTKPRPNTPYGASKLAAEQVVRRWASEDSSRGVRIIRPCAVYGERNVSNMMNLIRQINSGYFVLFGSGRNVKATAYVGNLVEAMALQMDQLSPGLRIFNYADKPDMTVREIVGIIRESLGKGRFPLTLPLWLGVLAAVPFELFTRITGKNLPVSIARVKKLATPTQVHAQHIRDAGFEQRVSSPEGLRRMVRHYKSDRPEPHAKRNVTKAACS